MIIIERIQIDKIRFKKIGKDFPSNLSYIKFYIDQNHQNHFEYIKRELKYSILHGVTKVVGLIP